MSPESRRITSAREVRPIAARQFGTVFESSSALDTQAESFVRAISQDVNSSRGVVLEGPPIYLGQTGPELPDDCLWTSPTFSEGWKLADAVALQLLSNHPTIPLYHHALVDDVNFIPSGGISMSSLRALAQLRRKRGLLGHHSVRRWESQLQHEANDTCSLMDARFQLDKLAAYDGYAFNVIVHPQSFGPQQQAMLERSLGLMKRDARYEHLTKKERRSLLETRYRHIWVDSHGTPTGLTRPVFDGQRFQHELIQ